MSRPAYLYAMLLFAALFTACTSSPPLPKPRAYPKVVYPEKGYQPYEEEGCPFAFDYPTYARISPDSIHLGDPGYNPCWFDIYFPDFDCRIYCSYYRIGEGKTLEELRDDAFELVDWHNKKANYIQEQRIRRGSDLEGMAFSIEGPAATPYQFFLTDNQTHFFRGALYFNTQINPDSLAPLYQFVEADLNKLIETFEWREATDGRRWDGIR